MSETKVVKWYKSRTLWANALMAGGTALAVNLPMLQPLMGPATYVAVVSVIAAVNCFLRLITTLPIDGAETLPGVRP